MITSPGIPYYFISWAGYNLPPKPVDPTDYEHAECLRTYSIFIFDENKRVVAFEKWLSNAINKDIALASGLSLCSGTHYFSAGAEHKEQLGEKLSLEETKNRTDYYRVRVNPDGTITSCERINRERIFRHDYSYWDNGQLRESYYQNSTVSGIVRGVERFDRNGKSIESD